MYIGSKGMTVHIYIHEMTSWHVKQMYYLYGIYNVQVCTSMQCIYEMRL